jgi:hypothetical protein
MKKLVQILCLVSLCGCMATHQKPGHSFVRPDSAEAVQPQDPKDGMTQNVTTSATEEKIIPAQSVVEMGTGTNVQKITISAPMPVKTTSSRNVETKVGGSQKNMMMEIGAKLASMRWIQFLGIVIALFGVASIAYPPLRLIINSTTTSAWLIGAGAALIFLPILIVGHEILILCFAVGGAGLWFFAHRHGGVTGELAALKSIFASGAGSAVKLNVASVAAPTPLAPPATAATPFKAP